MLYAQINPDTSMVMAVLECHSEINDSYMIPVNIENVLGKLYNGTEFVDAPNLNNYIKVTLNSEIYQQNTDIIVSVSVENALHEVIPINMVYYVPVIRTSDSKQVAFIKFDFVNGLAEKTLQMSEPGIYTVQVDKIYPKPTALLSDNIFFIVE